MRTVHRCQYLFNPGVWPYARRCEKDATVLLKISDSSGEFEDIKYLCHDHTAIVACDVTVITEELEVI